jgi:hypothetical protein
MLCETHRKISSYLPHRRWRFLRHLSPYLMGMLPTPTTCQVLCAFLRPNLMQFHALCCARREELRPAVRGRTNTLMNNNNAYDRNEGATYYWGLDRETSDGAGYVNGLSSRWRAGAQRPGNIAVRYRLTRATSTLCPGGGEDLPERGALVGGKRSRLAKFRAIFFGGGVCSLILDVSQRLRPPRGGIALAATATHSRKNSQT